MTTAHHTALFTFGNNDNGQLGHSGRHVGCPRVVRVGEEGTKLAGVWCGCGVTFVWDVEGRAWKAGGSKGGFLKVYEGYQVTSVVGNTLFNIFRTDRGEAYLDDAQTKTLTKLDVPTVKSIHSGALYAALLTTTGSVYTVGMNTGGQLGVPTPTPITSTPTKVPSLTALTISCGAEHVLAISPDGHLYGWGTAVKGELGTRCADGSPTPVRLTLDDADADDGKGSLRRGDVASVHCGDKESYLVTCSKTVIGWGEGIGDLTTLADVVDVTAGGGWMNMHALFTTSREGVCSVYAMGSNSRGQLGINPPMGVSTVPTFITIEETSQKDTFSGKYKLEDAGKGVYEWRRGSATIRKVENRWKMSLDSSDNDTEAYHWLAPRGNSLYPVAKGWSQGTDQHKMFGRLKVDFSSEKSVLKQETVGCTRPVLMYYNSSEPILKVKISAGWVHSAVITHTADPITLHWDGDFGSLSMLPFETCVKIAGYLGSRRGLALVSTGFYHVVQHDVFWTKRANRGGKELAEVPSDYHRYIPPGCGLYHRLLAVRDETRVVLKPRVGERLMSSFRGLFGSSSEAKMLMVGLDAAGKTSILYKAKLGEVVTTIPTIGFNVETVEVKGQSIVMWDVGGPDKIRALWRHYYEGLDGVIFVVDSNDRDRLSQAREELHRILVDETSCNPILVFANKQDLPHAMSCSEIVEGLALSTIRTREWYIQGSVATTGEGIYEGLEWMTKAISRQPRKKT